MDILHDLEYLAFASRLKRLAEQLMKDCSNVYRQSGLEFEARWFGTLYTLKVESPKSVTELADLLGLTHPAINQVVGALEKKKFVSTRRDRNDERRRLVSITTRGRRLLDDLQPLLIDIKEATRELVEDVDPTLLNTLSQLESQLSVRCMRDRIVSRIKQRQLDEVEILSYRPAFKRHFRILNEAWLRKYFAVEPHDARLLGDPSESIIKRGGQVFFASIDGHVVGTAALLKHNGTTYELAKMAVTPEAQGRQAGKKLALAIIEAARKLGASRLVLMTSPVLEKAVAMYRKLGFVERSVEDIDLPNLSRCSITMELILEPNKTT